MKDRVAEEIQMGNVPVEGDFGALVVIRHCCGVCEFLSMQSATERTVSGCVKLFKSKIINSALDFST